MEQTETTGVPGQRRPRRGFAVAGAVPRHIIRALAPAAEAAGYHTFWVNDEPDGDGLAALRDAAEVTATIRLGVGVIPLDRQGPQRISARIGELELPVSRLTLGVGSGHPAGGLARVRDGVAGLRELTAATLVVGAIGPRMCALAGEVADGLLLDWATPAYTGRAADIVAEASAAAGRPRPWIASYVFTALGAEATTKLRANADYYASLPTYGAHFARMAAGPLDTAAFADDDETLRRSLTPFDAALAETVVRAVVAAEMTGAYLEVLTAAAPS